MSKKGAKSNLEAVQKNNAKELKRSLKQSKSRGPGVLQKSASEITVENLQTLKDQLLPILISPRVDDIPQPIALTVCTSITLFLLGALTVFVFNVMETTQSCETLPLPIGEPFVSSCVSLISAQDFVVVEVLNGEAQQVEATLDVNFFSPQAFRANFLQLNSVEQIIKDIKTFYKSKTLFSLEEIEKFFPEFTTRIDANVLYVSYSVSSNTECSLEIRQNNLTFPSGKANVAATCFQDDLGILLYNSQRIDVDVLFQLSSYFKNIHRVVPESNSERTVLESFVNTEAAFCCIQQDFSFIIGFGFFAGLFYAFEGFVTFFYAVTVFKKTLGLEHKTRKFLTSYSAFTREIWRLGTSYRDLDVINMREEITNKKVDLKDLSRVVFNPRCRTIKHSFVVSSLTYSFVLAVSCLVSYIYANSEDYLLCNSLNVIDATDDCELDQSFNAFKFGSLNNGQASIPIQFTIRFKQLEGFVQEDLAQGIPIEFLVSSVVPPCFAPTLPDNVVSCLDLVESIENVSGVNVVTPNFKTSSHLLPTLDSDPNNKARVNITISKSRVDTRLIMTYEFENQFIEYLVKATVESSVSVYKQLETEEDSFVSTFIFTVLSTVSFGQVFEGLNAIVKCCEPDDFLEFFGISLGYLALFEGPLTLIFAMLVYGVVFMFWRGREIISASRDKNPDFKSR